MKVSVLIPTRGDRPQFLQHAHRMLAGQTLQPAHVEVVNDPPANASVKDITWRYRIGCDRIMTAVPDTDLILFIEDDDWYAPNYIETMSNKWTELGNPLTIGVGSTIYYHLGVRGWYNQSHPTRASAMSTGISPAGVKSMRWPKDEYVFTDIEIWKQIPGKTFEPATPIAIGIKHGLGLCGGIGHRRDLAHYKQRDPEFNWLRERVDAGSFDFYMSMLPVIK